MTNIMPNIMPNINIDQLKKKDKSKKQNNHFFINETKSLTSKVCRYDFFSANEINICEKIEKIPYYYHYFLILQNYDFIKVGKLGEKVVEDIDTIDLGNKSNDIINNKEKYLLFQYKNQYIDVFENFLFTLNTPKLFVLHVLESFSYLLDSLIKLSDLNICFFDLSTDNIVFNKDFKPLLQNFQKSIYISKLNEDFICKLIPNISDYTHKPLEVHVLFYLITNNLNTITNDLILLITEKYVENLSVLNIFSQNYVEKFKKECVETLNKYINKPKSDIICDIIEHNETWDLYSLSIIYLHIIGNIYRLFELKGTFISKLSIYLMKNIHPNPSKRENLKSIRSIYDGLFEEFQDWTFINKISHEKMETLLEILNE
jgi:hypothetical protein